MRRVLLLTCLFVLIASTAEARHRHRHWSGYAYFRSAPLAYGLVSPDKNLQRRSFAQGSIKPVDMVPPNWQLQPAEPNWKGKRFLSPDGTSWLAVYAFPATPKQFSTHMQSTAFVDGETVTYLRGERDWSSLQERRGTEFSIVRLLSPVAAKFGITSPSNILLSANERWTRL